MTGDSELVEKMRIRNVAKDDREDCILNEGFRGVHMLSASTKLLFRTQLAHISIRIKFMLFVSALIKLVSVACAVLCASPGYVLVNSSETTVLPMNQAGQFIR